MLITQRQSKYVCVIKLLSFRGAHVACRLGLLLFYYGNGHTFRGSLEVLTVIETNETNFIF